MIFMLCGTSDARELAVRIKQHGFGLLASVVTESAADSLKAEGLPVRIGRLTAEEMTSLVLSEGCKAILDASHPFAEEAHRNAMKAASSAGIPYIRFERELLNDKGHPKVTVVPSYEDAAMEAKKRKGSVMLTTGGKTLPLFAKHLLGEPEIRLVVRLLPRRDNMELCEALGIAQKDVIAMQGPFSQELNEALYRQYGTTVMVTKESGRTGSVDEKIGAALKLGIDVILISRPALEFGKVFIDFDSVIGQLRAELGMLYR